MRIFVVTVETGTARRRQQAAPPPPASSLPASLWLLAPSGLVLLLSAPNWLIWMRTVPLWWDKEGASSGTQPEERIPEMPSWFTFLISIWHLIWFVTARMMKTTVVGWRLGDSSPPSPVPALPQHYIHLITTQCRVVSRAIPECLTCSNARKWPAGVWARDGLSTNGKSRSRTFNATLHDAHC